MRDKARKKFNKLFKYENLKEQDIYLLIYFLQNELDVFDNLEMKTYKTKINIKKGEFISAYIRVKSDYFKDREAISFNDEGFIGFAGWADDVNIVPVVAGFNKWVDFMAANKELN